MYQSNDSSRMTLAFFTVSALDLLDALESSISVDERAAYVDWIYHCQHPRGGFSGFSGADLGPLRSAKNDCWNPANLAATYFALATLLVLGDDLDRVKRRECLRWIQGLQLEDGSFGEGTGEEGRVNGGKDVRFGYCAAGVRWILNRGSERAATAQAEDINVEALVRSVISLEVSGVQRKPDAGQLKEGGRATKAALVTRLSRKRTVCTRPLPLLDESHRMLIPTLQLVGHIVALALYLC